MADHPKWRTPAHSIRDALSFAHGSRHAAAVRDTAFGVFDRIQFAPPEAQMDALFVLAVAMANSLNLDAHEMVTRAKRLIPDVDAFNEQLNAGRDYAHGELKR